jgi:GMP synthase-like glutamine amidotransferase
MSGESNQPIRVKAFQHTPTEPLGFFEQLFAEHNIPFEYARLWEGDRVSMDGATHLVFLGGPMSVNDEKELPWLAEEKELIKRAVKKRVPVLGLCLGAQLIASAHGATVHRFINETGWYPVHTTPDCTGVFTGFPDTFRVFQMHGETFHLPVRARLQCGGDNVPHQGFRLGSALGLQFHLEMTGDLIRDWTKDERTFLQQKIGRDTERYLAESNQLCRQVAGEFLYGTVRNTR